MKKVKVLKLHENEYEPAGRKAEGTIYQVPADTAKSLIREGLVEPASEGAEASAPRK